MQSRYKHFTVIAEKAIKMSKNKQKTVFIPFCYFFTDYYLYVESSGRAAGDNARMFTGYLSKTNGTCFSFYYHMFGQTTGTLTLSIFPTDGSNLKKLFSVSGSQGSRWHFQRVDLKSPTSTYQVCSTS